MKEAFTYMFKDTGFKNKAIIFFIVCFLSSALLGYPEVSSSSFSNTITVTSVQGLFPLLLQILGMCVYLTAFGYYLNCINATVRQQTNIVFPLLNIKNSFIKGLRFYIAALLIIFPMAIIVSATYLINTMLSTCIGTLSLILLGIYILAFVWMFAVENRLTTFFRWGEAVALVKQNLKTYCVNYILAVLIFFAGAFVTNFIMYLLNYLFNSQFIPYIISTTIDALVVTYTSFVGVYLIAKSIKPSDV